MFDIKNWLCVKLGYRFRWCSDHKYICMDVEKFNDNQKVLEESLSEYDNVWKGIAEKARNSD